MIEENLQLRKNKMVFPKAMKVTVLRESGEKDNFLLTTDRHMEVFHHFDNLKYEVVVRYPELLKYEEIKFVWIDDEGDDIIILTHADYFDYMDGWKPSQEKRRIYVRGVNKLPQPIPTFEQQPSEAPMEQAATFSRSETAAPRVEFAATPPCTEAENLPLHSNIVCDVCDETIRGHRYKCLQCFNYDLCMRCENRMRHKDHLMVRIPTPEVNRRSPFRLFDKLRSYAAEVGAQSGFAAASDFRDDDYENSKRSKRHHRRHSKERDDSKECREEKERKERKQRRERCAKSSEERRSGGRRHRFDHGFNFTHLINQVIDPANIQSAFISADAAAAAAAAAAESAEEAVRASMANCPVFETFSSSRSASASTSATTSASAPTQNEPNSTVPTNEKPQESSPSPPATEAPQSKPSTSSNPSSPKQLPDVIDLSWLAPTPESIQRINKAFSTILDPFGMNMEIRSNGSPKPAQTQTPTEEKKDKTTETANTPTTSTPSQTPPGGAGTSSKATEPIPEQKVDPVVELEQKMKAVIVDHPEPKQVTNQTDTTSDSSDEDDSSSGSSVSLLSDNDDFMAAVEKAEKRWTMLDIPIDSSHEATQDSVITVEEVATDIAKVSVTVPAAVNVQEPAAVNVPEPVIASTSSIPATPAATATGSYPEAGSASSANNGSTSKPLDYEQLGKALKQHLEAEQQAASANKQPSNSPTPSVAPKEATPPPPAPTVSVPVAQPAVNVVFSRRPHVNHAVHAMMSMGFSNEGGWLTQLLDSVNGDIPKALDLLTPHKINH